MDDQHSAEHQSVEAPAHERRPWFTPRLERLDFDGTEMAAKNPSSFEGSTSYNSPALSA
jgi:hypothetical protein